MSLRTSLIAFGAMMAVGVASYGIAVTGWYPVAVVNWHVISDRMIETNLATAYVYFHNALMLSGKDPALLDTPAGSADLRRAVLDDAIAQVLVRQELDTEMRGSDLRAVVDKKVDQALQNQANVITGAEKLYGLSMDDFKARILLPQAYQEVLSGRMLLQGKDFDSWLAESRKSANVIILLPGFSWNGNSVKISF